jgi:coiled-coil domain-containing protein 55
MYASALAEDPNAFEYDSLYESMQEQKVAPKQQERLARRPKYIASLLEQAEVRKKEQGITYERMLVSTSHSHVEDPIAPGLPAPCLCC